MIAQIKHAWKVYKTAKDLDENALDLMWPWWVKPLIYLVVISLFTWWVYGKGVQSERAKWKLKENAELVKRQQQIVDLTAENRALEQARVKEQADLVNTYQEQINHEKNRAKLELAAVVAKSKRLSISTKGVPACASAASSLPATTATSDTASRAELSDEAAQFLIGLASEADEVTKQLKLCQDMLKATRP